MNRPQEDHADLGLVDDDNTEDMRKPPAATEGFLSDQSIRENRRA